MVSKISLYLCLVLSIFVGQISKSESTLCLLHRLFHGVLHPVHTNTVRVVQPAVESTGNYEVRRTSDNSFDILYEPVQFDALRDHTIVRTDSNFVYGLLRLKAFPIELFFGAVSGGLRLTYELKRLLLSHLIGVGIQDDFDVEFDRISSRGDDLEVYYRVPCGIRYQHHVKNGLINACKQRCVVDLLSEIKRENAKELRSDAWIRRNRVGY